MSSPGQGEFTGANHTHGGSGVRDPDGSLRPERANVFFPFRVLWRQNDSDYLVHTACDGTTSFQQASLLPMASVREREDVWACVFLETSVK